MWRPIPSKTCKHLSSSVLMTCFKLPEQRDLIPTVKCPFQVVCPLPALPFSSLIQKTLLSCVLGKPGWTSSPGCRKAFQSYNQTFISSRPANYVVVAPVWTGTGDSQTCLSRSNQGDPIDSSKVMWQKWKTFTFTFSTLKTSGCPDPGRDWDRKLRVCISLSN